MAPKTGWVSAAALRKTYNRAVTSAGWRGVVFSRIGFVWLLWTVFGCYSAVESRYQSVMWDKPMSWRSLFFSELSYSWISALLTPLTLRLAERYGPQTGHWIRTIAVHGCAGVAYASAVKLAWDVVLRPPRAFYKGGITLHSIAGSIAGGLDSGVLLYWIVVVAAWAYEYHRKLEAEVLAASELRRQFANAQVDALRMQMHPHFLFNTLHTVTGLLQDDANAAERMIARLSVFLRHSLKSARTPIVPLWEELEFVRLYLEIETVRFEERLSVHYDIQPEAAQALVPNLILQPLVENAIRYAIARRTSDGKVTITARLEDGQLYLTVMDNGAGPEAQPIEDKGGGLGLSNARERLKVLYGARQDLLVKQTDEGGWKVIISLPFEQASRRSEDFLMTEIRTCAS